MNGQPPKQRFPSWKQALLILGAGIVLAGSSRASFLWNIKAAGNLPEVFAIGFGAGVVLTFLGFLFVLIRAIRGSGTKPAVPTQAVPAQELRERIVDLRWAILAAIPVQFVGLVNISHIGGYLARVWHLGFALAFGLHQIPFLIVLLGIRNRERRWLSAALMFSILSLCFTATSSFYIYGMMRASFQIPASLVFHLLGPVMSAVVLVFAWRAWHAGGQTSNDGTQLVLWGMVSAIYLLLTQWVMPLIVRLSVGF